METWGKTSFAVRAIIFISASGVYAMFTQMLKIPPSARWSRASSKNSFV
jgi:hypothetical protein